VTVARTEWAALAQWRRQAPLIGALGLVAAVAIIGLAWAFVRQLATRDLLQQARIQGQRDRQARARFEAASRAKSYFLANMSHELRTPLNAILGFSEILQIELFGPLGSPRYRGYAEDINRSGTHLLNLVNDILDFSKSEEHRINLERDEVNVAGVVEAAVAMLRREAEAAGLRLEAVVEPGLPALMGDEMRLKQVLVNLLSNAIKFTDTGGSIAVRVRRRGDWLVLDVSDTGIGIAAEDMATVLEPFGQVESTLVRKYPGTGLGLPLSKRIIELLGGSLVITSTVGVGTTVTVEIPLSGADTAVAAAGTAAAMT
jgi:signal transduction histidine kinase